MASVDWEVKSQSVSFAGRMTVRAAMVLLAAGTLTGCGGDSIREALGYNKNAPDEFAIVTKAPLIVPPNFALRPPQPGATRAQASPQRTAETALFGSESTGSVSGGQIVTASLPSEGEQTLLANAGAGDADPQIRAVVNAETRSLEEKSKTFVDEVLFWQEQTPPDAHIVDATAEVQRLRENEATGKPVTEGETPAIEPKRKGWLEGIF